MSVEVTVTEEQRASGGPLCVMAATAGGFAEQLSPFTLTVCTRGKSQLSMVPYLPRPMCSGKCGKMLLQPFATFRVDGQPSIFANRGACSDEIQGIQPGSSDAAAIQVQKVARGKAGRKKAKKKKKK